MLVSGNIGYQAPVLEARHFKGTTPMSFSSISGSLGMLAGICGLLYLVAFLITRDPSGLAASLLLMGVGVGASALIVALYQRLRIVDAGFALWGCLLALAGAGGATVHGAFDLANNLHPPGITDASLSAIDPRGFLTFCIAGLGTIIMSWLLLRGAVLAQAVALLGIVSGVLLIALYVAFLVLLDPGNPLIIALVVATGVVQPVWNLSAGWLIWRNAGNP